MQTTQPPPFVNAACFGQYPNSKLLPTETKHKNRGMGLIFDDICVFVGMIVVWCMKGRKGSLKQELGTFRFGGLYSGRWREGIIGFATFLIIIGLIWAGAVYLER
ncbi:MAG: hypothetical protein JSS11_07745 [Verrucomicrobia bacterium]|nr:hypothetical protein [Verrucomicrobiota bacterium]